MRFAEDIRVFRLYSLIAKTLIRRFPRKLVSSFIRDDKRLGIWKELREKLPCRGKGSLADENRFRIVAKRECMVEAPRDLLIKAL